MQALRNLRINTKLTLFVVLTTLFGVFFVGSALLYQKVSTFDKRLLEETTLIAKSIADRSNAGVVFNDLKLIKENIASLIYNRSIDLACLYLTPSGLAAEYKRTVTISCPDYIAHSKASELLEGISSIQPIVSDKESGEVDGYVYLLSNKNELYHDLEDGLYVMGGVSVLVLLWAIAFSFFIRKYISHPLTELYEASREYKITNKPVEILSRSRDEVGTLVDSFNDMTSTISAQNLEILKHSENLKAEVELQTRRLSLANKELEAFSYAASHDLNSPVRQTFVLANAILFDQGSKLSRKAKKDLNMLLTVNRRAARIIEGMKKLAGITERTIKIEKIDLTAACIEQASALKSRDPLRKVDFIIQNGMNIKGDNDLVVIMVANLMENAWKYSALEQHAVIEVGSNDEYYYFRDNGDGFDSRWIEKLFTPFKRLHPADEFEGTGLGLAIVKRILDAHDWQVDAISEKGEGAEFRIYTRLKEK